MTLKNMKRIISPLVLILFLTSCNHSSKSDHHLDLTERDKKEILEFIQSESEAFYSRNFEGWTSHFSDDPISWTCVEENEVVLEAYTKKSLDKLVGDYMESNPEPLTLSIERENFLFIPDVNSVWVSFDEYQISQNKTKVLKETRLMTRSNEHWTISGMNSSLVRIETNQGG
jgi:hypothetical protein